MTSNLFIIYIYNCKYRTDADGFDGKTGGPVANRRDAEKNRKGMNMKRNLHIIKPVLIMLLVLCTVLSSCVTGDAPLTGSDNGTHEHSTTGDPNGTKDPNGDENNNGDGSTTCTHAITTLVGAVEATCTKEGYTGDTVCTACTEVVTQGTSIAKKEHEWNEGKITKNPTCISTGVKTITCTACGDTMTETLGTVEHNDLYHDRLDGETHSHTCSTCTMSENQEHNPDPDSAVPHAVTCLEDAYTEYTCLDCEGVYKVYGNKAEDKAPGRHTFGEWSILLDSTCEEEGMKTRSCACGAHEELTIEIDDNKHKWEEESRSAATCISAGSVTYVCTVCHDHQSSPLTATGVHKYETLSTGNDGWTTQKCQNCTHEIRSFNAADVVAEVKADALSENENFGVTTQTATIEFPKEVVSQLKASGNADIAIGAEVVKDKENLLANASKLSEEQKERLSDVDIFDFSVTINDQKLDQNFNKAVTVTLPYELKAGENPDGIVIWYVADDGEIEPIAAVYDAETRTVSFSAEHFSFYAVAYKETQEMQCRRGHHNYLPTSEVVEATCESYGYTVCECTCGAKMLDQIVEKLGHDYGDIVIEVEVDCENGGWNYQECSKCHHVLNVKYVPALGHKPDQVATCTEASTCTVCNKVVKPALGHAWTDWTVVLEPTEVNSGLRRRYCLTCGEMEEVRLAATGNVQALTFDSYEEMLGAILSETLNFGNGKINVSYIMNGITYTFDMKVNEENGAYTILVDVTMSSVVDGQTVSQTVSALYNNGVLAYVRETGNGKVVSSGDLETLIGAPIEICLNYMEQLFELVDPSVAMALEQVKAMLDEYGTLYGADINAILAAAGSEYTYEELYALLDSFETVYAYAALKLGYQPSLGMHEGVEVPTKNDFVAVISAFMTKTEGEGRVDYEWNIEPLMSALNTVVEWFLVECEKPVTEVFYDLFGSKIAESLPELTDWDACVAYVRENLPGTTTIKDAVDWLITLLEETEICTIEDIYALIDAYAFEMSGEQFDTAAFVAEYGMMTLDDLVEAMIGEEGATLDMLYQELDGMLSEMIFGDLTLMLYGEEVSISDLSEMAAYYLSMVDLTLDFSFAVDEKGNLLEINLDHKFNLVGEDENGEPVTMELESMSMLFVIDDSITIDVPAIMQPVISNRVTATYDQNGNLIISGLDGSFTCEFSIKGYDVFTFTDLLKRDDAMSAQLGIDVYVTEKAFWTQSQRVNDKTILQINGKYYEAEYKWFEGSYEVTSTVAWAEMIENPAMIMPDSESNLAGYYMEYPVYDTVLGYAYLCNDGWMLMIEYDYNYEWRVDETTGKEYEYRIFSVWEENTLASVFENAYIGSIRDNDQKVTVNGETVYLSIMTVMVNEYTSFDLYCYVEDDTIVVVQLEWVGGKTVYTLGNELTTLPAHDYQDAWNTMLNYVDKDGNEVIDQVKRIDLYQYLPTYYVKVADGVYVSVNNLCDDVNVDGLTQITLPDGNVMYVLGTVVDKTNGGNNTVGGGIVDVRPEVSVDTTEKVFAEKDQVSGGVVVDGTVSGGMVSGGILESTRTLTYGYVKLADGLYVQVRCYGNGETVEEVEYRDTASDRYAEFDNVYDLDQYMTKNADGTYTVSAELINKLKAHCTDEGDAFAINVIGTKTADGTTYTTYATVGTYMVPMKVTLGGMMGSDAEAKPYVDWDALFNGNYGGNDDGALYQTQINPDGSITLTFRNGTTLNVECNVGGNVIADDYLIYNEEESQKTGLQIYDAKESDESSVTYAYVDGKYYYYTWGSGYGMTVADSVEQLIASGWYLSEMTYRFDVKLDENSDETYPVYDARVKLYRDTSWTFNNSTITVYFMVIDGELYALKQAVNLGDGMLRFESYVKASEYFASLAVGITSNDKDGERNKYTTVFVNGVATDIYSERVSIYETDANGEPLIDLAGDGSYVTYVTTVYYMLVNGQKQYLVVMERLDGSYLILGEEVTVDLSEYVDVKYSDSKCDNGTFQMARLSKIYVTTTHFVKLAGKCYRLDSYQWNRFDEESFREQFYEEMYCYRIWDEATQSFKYYTECEFVADENGEEVAVLYGEIDTVISGGHYDDKFIGKTAESVEVYAVTVYYLNPDEVVVEEQEDGTVLYARPMYGDYYLKGQDGYYVIAYFVMNYETGVEELVCELERAYVDGDILADMGVFDQYVTVDGNTVTISKDIFNLINDDNRYDFQIEIKTNNGDRFTFDYFRLIELFNMKEDDWNNGEDGKEDWGDLTKPEDGKEDYIPEDGKEDYIPEDGKEDDIPEDGKEDLGMDDPVIEEEEIKEEVKEEITESEKEKK